MQYGKRALAHLRLELPLQVLMSNAGFYIGTLDEEGPASRESVEYYPSRELTQQALDNGTWTQREY
ncbi:hypothetical protein ACOY4E_08040 [Pseudomonas aeruginosa]|uniref:hypothetical protein n=1 Tax=Pseudomonas aeruginosa TaxID=287 RepID=UPI00053E4F5E|nr:hypothetical protein [Pseudomonas aeruginosa]KSK41091.1 hypothetical protein APA25_26745 [Pseudomonas aeruginosa]MBG5234581.1 hypothetical protein [Pseudomonas aeruginosa]MBH8871217.1 hypothetical protein [Pseudomonas aeruginosa]MBH9176993.1 hypothetical protein [Pseudomonas aeruginosa]MBW6288907.1 hypothetical protein [Pseudomonas aeruginosa]